MRFRLKIVLFQNPKINFFIIIFVYIKLKRLIWNIWKYGQAWCNIISIPASYMQE